MSPEGPQFAPTSTSTGPGRFSASRDQYYAAPEPQTLKRPRDIVRLFQCRQCSLPLAEPVTLPCGRSLCRTCVPETHARVNITYPALPGRLQGFCCPFPECGKEHAMGDCTVDVILNKVVQMMAEEMERGQAEATTRQWMTQTTVLDPWAVAGVASLRPDESSHRSRAGGKLVATWALVSEGHLRYDDDVTYGQVSSSTSGSESEDIDIFEGRVLQTAQDAARTEMDCQICYALFFDPFTTGCGHTFCRSCLHRILDHSAYCPICRRKLTITPLLNRASCPSNEGLSRIIEAFWIEELAGRRAALAAEETERYREFDTPLFVCTLSFPTMPTFLHVFEPRYRLMIRRALEGNGTFGMVLPRHASAAGEHDFYELGTLLRIVNIQPFPDGRSLIETRGLSRFRVLRRGSVDGYLVGATERIDDVSVEEEEAIEASEVIVGPDEEAEDGDCNGSGHEREHDDGFIGPRPRSTHGNEPSVQTPETMESLDSMSTQRLMRIATAFVAKMRAQSVPWLTQRMLEMYPEDPAVFPWWFASMLPVKDLEKYRLLGTTSVRERLKICCAWIIEWERTRWSLRDCVIL